MLFAPALAVWVRLAHFITLGMRCRVTLTGGVAATWPVIETSRSSHQARKVARQAVTKQARGFQKGLALFCSVLSAKMLSLFGNRVAGYRQAVKMQAPQAPHSPGIPCTAPGD